MYFQIKYTVGILVFAAKMLLQFTLVILLLLLLVQPLAAAGKLGLCCLGCTPTTYEPFANATSWVYRYSLFVDDADAAEWLAKRDAR